MRLSACGFPFSRIYVRKPDDGNRVLLPLSQTRQGRQLLQILSHWLGRSSPEGYAFAAQNFVGQNAALTAEHHSLFDAGVLSNADLAPQHHAVLNHDAAREAGLGRNHNVFAELAVVADVDQVVDLRASTDARFVERAAVDGRV